MGAAQEALGVVEILENVLQRLDFRDTLYNAQAVSSFWRNCIRGSPAISKKVFFAPTIVDDGCADEQLYYTHKLALLGCLSPDQLHQITERLTPGEELTLPNVRLRRLDVSEQSCHTFWRSLFGVQHFVARDQSLPFEHFDCFSDHAEKFALGMIRTSTAHSQILRHFWADKGYIWTGYGAHGVLYIHGAKSHKNSRFAAFSEVLDQIPKWVAYCPTASWLDSSLTKPALTTLSTFGRVTSQKSVWKSSIGRCNSATGITIRDFLQLLIDIAIEIQKEHEIDQTLAYVKKANGNMRGFDKEPTGHGFDRFSILEQRPSDILKELKNSLM